jgi:hypothetical protein
MTLQWRQRGQGASIPAEGAEQTNSAEAQQAAVDRKPYGEGLRRKGSPLTVRDCLCCSWEAHWRVTSKNRGLGHTVTVDANVTGRLTLLVLSCFISVLISPQPCPNRLPRIPLQQQTHRYQRRRMEAPALMYLCWHRCRPRSHHRCVQPPRRRHVRLPAGAPPVCLWAPSCRVSGQP